MVRHGFDGSGYQSQTHHRPRHTAEGLTVTSNLVLVAAMAVVCTPMVIGFLIIIIAPRPTDVTRYRRRARAELEMLQRFLDEHPEMRSHDG